MYMLRSKFLFVGLFVLIHLKLESQNKAVSVGTGVEYLRVRNHLPLYNLYSNMHPKLSVSYQLYFLENRLLLGAGYKYGGFQYNILDLEHEKRIHQKFNMHAAVIRTMYVSPIFNYLFKKKSKGRKNVKELNFHSGLTQCFVFSSSWNPFSQQLNGKDFIKVYQLFLSTDLELKFYSRRNKVSSVCLGYDWGINDIDRVFYSKSRLNGVQISITKYLYKR